MIHKLDDQCRRAYFTCGDNEIDKWFRTKSLKLHLQKRVVVYKARRAGGDDAIGFCSYNIERYDNRLLPRIIASVFDSPGNPHVFHFWFMGFEPSFSRKEWARTSCFVASRTIMKRKS